MSLSSCVKLSQEPINHASILVVDEDAVQWTIARSILEIMPLSLYHAASGEEAEALSASIGFDLVLMDRHLGARDGDACATRLRAQLCGARYAAILACALDTEGPHGASVYDGLVIKPYSVLSLTKGVLLGLETMRQARLAASVAEARAAFG